MKQEFKTCTDCKRSYNVSDSPSKEENCRDCYNANRKIVRQELAKRNGCRNYAHYMKLKKIGKINEEKSREVWAENFLKTYL
jgi:hypothetical protein